MTFTKHLRHGSHSTRHHASSQRKTASEIPMIVSHEKIVPLYQDNQDESNKHYRKRSLVESVLAVLKGVFGNNLSSKKKLIQGREPALRVICYNMRVVNLMDVRKHVRGRF